MGSRIKQKALMERAERVIPGGMYGHESTLLLPPEFPQFFKRALGARIWDADENSYIDYMCAYGPNLLGYRQAGVEAAAEAQRLLGDTMTGPSEIMVELAEAFVGMVTHADWAMFCKNGGDATSMAMVLARAHTGRKTILCAKGAYHGAAPWCTPRTSGILDSDRAHIAYYEYNDAQSLFDAFKAHDGDVAAVFATPFRHEVFEDQALAQIEFARAARQHCDETGALLVVDDVRAGFRVARDCSWMHLGIEPDLSCWGKCFANGYPISALLGSNKARDAARSIFVTGSFWFSAVPMAAAIETLRTIRETPYLETLVANGDALRAGLDGQSKRHGIELKQTGPSQMPQIFFADDPDFRIGYAWAAACLNGGAYFHPYHNMFLSAAHTLEDVEETLEATDKAFDAVLRNFSMLQPHPVLMQLSRG
ncbi:aminotransferase class III-fold pyridoxal phosphate-dependent enzyme [Sphingopyxis granuli]|jgi:glutamate-1-semialdehyde 2,1-aminomutase|uniref:aminotransferase class III-fold pyridoxal phosphate-dependent enzyme n=1 Tax=Sphingopyxis granuli TaxID=267128 RepID=UPI00301B7775